MMLIAIFVLLPAFISFSRAEEAPEGEVSPALETTEEFKILKVNRVEKLWVISPDKRSFMGMDSGITKFDQTRPIAPDKRGEDYVIAWRYYGEDQPGPLVLRFEYRTLTDMGEVAFEEYEYDNIKRKLYTWTFKNIGQEFITRGMVDRWKVSLILDGEVVAMKRSSTWHAMEGDPSAEESF